MNDMPRLGAGQDLVYEFVSPPRLPAELDAREQRLLDGALSFHALTRPTATLRVTVLRTDAAHFPALTDLRTERIEWADDRVVVGSVVVRHRPAGDAVGGPDVDLVVDLGGPPALLSSHLPPPSRLSTVRDKVRSTSPVGFDVLRQLRTDRLENRRLARPIPRVKRIGDRSARTSRELPKAALFGMHWLELGGAEKWAAETVRLAKEAGLLPIILTDQPSAHPDVAREVFDGALVIPLTHPLSNAQESTLLRRLFEEFDVRGIHLHHCVWLYQRLPWIRAHYPWVEMVDSLHIVEWRTGGFVDIAFRMSNVMDQHHVISPALRDYLVDKQGLPNDKVVLATLADLTASPATTPAPAAAATDAGPVTVAFVGRLTQQKRPYLFLRLAARLRKRLGDQVRFVLHGDGELAADTARLRQSLGLDAVTTVRGPDVPVSTTFDEADLLVISSDNEGVTLTSFEADSAGVLVISSDVGSQASVVAADLLLPRAPLAFLDAGEQVVTGLVRDPARRAALLAEQRQKMTDFAELPRARDWTSKLYEGWAS